MTPTDDDAGAGAARGGTGSGAGGDGAAAAAPGGRAGAATAEPLLAGPAEALRAAGWQSLTGAGTGRFTWHPRARRLDWDEACAALFDATTADDPMALWQDHVHPEDVADLFAALGERAGEVVTFRWSRPGRPVRHVLAQVTHVREGGADGRRLSGVALDVTAIQQLADRAAVVLETMHDAVASLDADLRVLYANGPATALVARGPLVGRVLTEVVPEVVGLPVHELLLGVLATGVSTTREIAGTAAGQWYEITAHRSRGVLHALVRDVRERHDAETAQQELLARLEHLATHDPLTGLLHTRRVSELVGEHLAAGGGAAAAFVDLDRFKRVNDTWGHAVGDALLVEVARRMRCAAGPGALVGRTGGDEFIVVLLDADRAGVEAVARAVVAAVGEVTRIGGAELRTSASAGLATSGPARSAEELVHHADVALYRAKEAGRGVVAWYDQALHAEVVERVHLEADLRTALGEEELGAPGAQLQLHYLPSYDLATGRPRGVEALLRWERPGRGPVAPLRVVPVAEDSGLVVPLGAAVIAAAARQAARWAHVPDLVTWVNASPRQLAEPGLAEQLRVALRAAGVPPQRFGVEITESVLVERSAAVAELEAVRALGVKLAVDDFGTGYSSLARLVTFPLDVIKVDRSFVTASDTPRGEAALAGILTLAHALGTTTIAEGVESWEQLARLRMTPCDTVSGHLFGPPLPPDRLDLGPVGLDRRRAPRAPRPPLAADGTGQREATSSS